MRSFAAVMLLSLAAATPAAAQSGANTVAAALDQGAAAHGARGHRPVEGDFSASLRIGQPALWAVPVTRGRTYVVHGACDGDCRDLDMEMYDVDGAFAEQDVATDAAPFVQLTPRRDGTAYVRIWLADCVAEPCAFGARVMAGGERVTRAAAPAIAPRGNPYVSHVGLALTRAGARHTQEGFTLIARPDSEAIAPVTRASEGHRVRYTLAQGATYRFQAACDQDCSDVDIEVLDPAGRSIARDIAVDAAPYVEVRAQRAGEHSVRAWLANCAQEPCYVGVRGYVRRER